MASSATCEVYDNDFVNGGLFLSGSTVNEYVHTIERNTVNQKKLGYFLNQSTLALDGAEYGQIIIVNSSFIDVTGGVIDNATLGVYIGYSDNCTISGLSSVNNLMYGIYVFQSPDSSLEDCYVDSTEDHGVYFYASDRGNLDNITSINGGSNGIYFYASEQCTAETINVTLNEESGIHVEDGDNFSGNNVFERNCTRGIVILWSHNSLVQDSSFMHNVDAGILVSVTDNITLLDNTISWCYYAVEIGGSEDANLTGNTALYSVRGFNVFNCPDIVMESNTGSHNEYGFYLSSSSNGYIHSNYAENNTIRGFYCGGGWQLINNTARTGPVGFYVAGTMLDIRENTATENQIGFLFSIVPATDVDANTISHNTMYGIVLDGCSSLAIENNTLTYNDVVGIFIINSGSCTLKNNTFMYNTIGLEIQN
ncbi:MAG: hypothetical protein GF411_03725, partial [Candidatus Lokiarchaeota archaeon]|nr:hypothetical protein [Candidatus Lokiarchaeota archaeon]